MCHESSVKVGVVWGVVQRAADKAADTRAERYGETRHTGGNK